MEILDLLSYTVSGVLGYAVALTAAGVVQDLSSEPITSQEHLEEVVREEAAKLGLDSRLIVPTFYAQGSKIRASRASSRYYMEFEGRQFSFHDLDLKAGFGGRRNTVRHELYHIAKHVDATRRGVVKYFFYEEPTAILYALLGIQL